MKRFSKIVSIALVALLAIALVGCSTTSTVESVPEIVLPAAAPATPAPSPAPAPAPVPASADEPVAEEVVEVVAPAVAEEPADEYPFGVTPIVKNTQGDDVFDLFIIHTNDVHARVTAGEDDGAGYAKLATIIKTARSITNNVLVLDAGDVTHGTNFANLFNGATIGDLLIMSGYDAVAPGNHDFNYGIDNLLALSDAAEEVSDLKVLSANITDEDGYLLFQPYQLYDFNGFKVCVIGLTTPDTKTKSHPKNTEGVEFDNPVIYQNAQAAIDLAHEIADYVVVLGHIGTVADGESGLTSTIICENIDGIDLFVDGHSHSVLSGDNYVNGTLIVSAGEYMQNIGVVDILVKDGEVASEDAFLIASSDVLDPANSALAKQYGIVDVPDDPEVEAYIESVNEAIEARFGEVVATIPTDLDGERDHVRTRKTNLSAIVCDAITAETGADFTIVNGGGIRASLSAGDVTLGEVNAVLPFTNIVTVCEITGDEVYQALEHGYSMLPETNGAFSQTDLQVVYSESKPAGERIDEVLLDGEPIDRNAVYTVATNDFMAAGGDGYTMFGRVLQEGRVLNEVFADYLAELYPPAN
ncbi:MAG TPA: 5'-nucleotidase C-terminal domain-containing protein [Candidatus Ornithospirochaeta stercorigallinarum]|nr:5'-nucleotidase C-terminal domain-containing protein [Candidatus Ornithospirochaeta stercorigallinarum]